MDFTSFLDDLFNFGGGGHSDSGGTGLAAGWSYGLSSYFSQAGPLGRYLGYMVANPGSGLYPDMSSPLQPEKSSMSNNVWNRSYNAGFASDSEGDGARVSVNFSLSDPPADAPSDTTPATATSQPDEPRTLESLDRGTPDSNSSQVRTDEVQVFGTPRSQPRDPFWVVQYARQLTTTLPSTYFGSEISIDTSIPSPRRPKLRRTATRNSPPADDARTQSPRPERDPGDPGSSTGVYDYSAEALDSPEVSDAPPVPPDFLPGDSPFGSRSRQQKSTWDNVMWDSPFNTPLPQPERSVDRMPSIGAAPTAPIERSFWNRGGTGLATGAFAVAVGVGIVLIWNPVGWAALGAALSIAGGVAATTASAV